MKQLIQDAIESGATELDLSGQGCEVVPDELEGKGIEFELEDEGFIRLALFTDLDKNALFLAENKE